MEGKDRSGEMKDMRGRQLLWLIVIASCMGCAGRPAGGDRPSAHVPARNVQDILLLVRDLAMKGECANDEFYSTDVMHRLFGSEVRADRREGDEMLAVSMHGFQQLVGGRKMTQQRPGSLEGVWLDARKQSRPASKTVCSLRVAFHGKMRGREFKSVVRVLGPGWSRDHDAETQRNLNCCLHSWNPKSMASERPMGNAIIVYPAGPTELVLEFDGAGELRRIVTFWPQP
ncbi:hypothetical protein GCM10011488_48220 [Steroidobacter agaridevorans]|nr:hypothetical protein GCM10011488_48220 [Steroidobacter agaridevorans]